jgi:hypothetical protein
MPNIEVNEFGRIVSVDGRIDVPHVTDVLRVVGISKDYEGVDPYYAARGNAVHLGCNLIVRGELDESSVSDEIRPYLEDFKQVLKDPELKVEASELAAYCSLHDFCTTIDLVVKYRGKREVWDIKTSKNVDPSVEVQTAGHAIALQGKAIWVDGRRYLRLTGDGDPKIGKDHSHVKTSTFLSALDIYRWKMSHKRTKK